MGELGIRGVSHSYKVRTTIPDNKADRPPDLVDRDFTAQHPNLLWVMDLTFVSKRSVAAPSPGIVADSLDNALAKTVNLLYKAELIRHPDQGPWHTVGDVELATLGWVHWYNNQHLHGYSNDVPPAEFKDAYHAERRIKQPLGNQ